MSVGSGGFESKAAVQWQMRRLLVLPATILLKIILSKRKTPETCQADLCVDEDEVE